MSRLSRRARVGSLALVVSALAAAVTAMTPAFGSAAGLQVSTHPGRSAAHSLRADTVNGNVFVFYRGNSVAAVTFYVDLTTRANGTDTWARRWVEHISPYDLEGTAADGTAGRFDTTRLSNGQHEVAVVVEHRDSSTTTERASFTVDNAGGSAPEPGPPPSDRRVISANFDSDALGPVTAASFAADVGSTNPDAAAYNGMSYVRDTRRSGVVVRTRLDAHKINTSPGGDNGNVLLVALPSSRDAACMSYDVRFSPDFDFSLGGKLPGLLGVAPNVPPATPTGGGPTGSGWSARLMWLGPRAYSFAGEGGNDNMAVTYLYHAGQTGVYGDNVEWHRHFVDGEWHHVRQCHAMNTPGRANGSLRAWVDGDLVVDRTDVRYRSRSDVHITHFDWSIFRGGNTLAWAGSRDGYVDLDNVRVASS